MEEKASVATKEVSPVAVTKKPWQSKTLWIALIAAVIPFFPGAETLVKQYPEVYSVLLGAIFAGLRAISNDKISIS
jgi:hypothetical protein